MTRRVQNLNRRLQAENSSHRVTMRIFNSVVRIQFNARVEREIFARQPARRISRRHSTNVRSAIIAQCEDGPVDQSMFAHPSAPTVAPAANTSMSAAELMSNDFASADSQASCSSQVIPFRRKRRAASVDSAERQYIAPDELRSTIENLRRTLGKLCFTYHLRFLKRCVFFKRE